MAFAALAFIHSGDAASADLEAASIIDAGQHNTYVTFQHSILTSD